MLSDEYLKRLITDKRREIEKEKTLLGLSPIIPDVVSEQENKENGNANGTNKCRKQVKICNRVLEPHNGPNKEDEEEKDHRSYELEEIPPDLDRYIRRYLGLPVMLKAGEYSPNNPLIRGERPTGDVLFGLGEYERRRNTLRKLRQQQYREYLDQQAKKKQEEKEKTERERREREERDREREESERQIQRERLERERESCTDRRRASICAPTTGSSYSNKVDTGVQVNGVGRPLSVAVQTDEAELFRLAPPPNKNKLTEAERELSPHTVVDIDDRPIQPAAWAEAGWGGEQGKGRRGSYGNFDSHSPVTKKSNRDKLISDLRHTYMPSIFDADAIEKRNLEAEKEAATRRQFYQQELRKQIAEQQRIREERRAREELLERAEVRRLELQLTALRPAREHTMKENANEYEKKRTQMQKEIDMEYQALRAASLPSKAITNRKTHTSKSDNGQNVSKLPFYYPRIMSRSNEICTEKKSYSTNIPDNSIFSQNYDVDSYLRRNLNPSKESLLCNRIDTDTNYKLKNLNIEDIGNNNYTSDDEGCAKVIVEKAIIHECPNTKTEKYEPSFLRKDVDYTKDKDRESVAESLPIAMLRHSPKNSDVENSGASVSEAMKVVEHKWKVPVVQKNILKSMPSEEGKNVSILTQLGSIRRQLQLEQMKLDNMLSKNNEL